MRWLVLTGLLVALTACAATAPATAPFTADQVAAALQASGMPVSAIHIYTAETDENKLLGRPGQYVGKLNWTDARTGNDAQDNATVEIFSDRASMDTRMKYLEPFNKVAFMAQYMHAHPKRLAVLRLPHELTPDQAKQYEDWFDKL